MTATALAPDAVDVIAGNGAAALRASRPTVRTQLQAAHDALFDPRHGDFGFTPAERSVVALFVAALHRDDAAIAHYGSALNARGVAGEIEEATLTLADEAGTTGPYGTYPAGSTLHAESVAGPELALPLSSVFGLRLARGLEYAHRVLLHPRDGRPQDLAALREAGWSGDQTVILTQIVAALSFQLRVAAGARAVASAASEPADPRTPERSRRRGIPSPDPGAAGEHPRAFTDLVVAWKPWIGPSDHDPHEGFDWPGTFGKRRASSPSFRLSARDPYVSLPLSRLEDDIFADEASGLGRAERELGALTVSRENGCLYCASVHSRATARFSGRLEDVRAVLDEGPRIDLGGPWNVFADAALALTATPVAFDGAHAHALIAAAGDAEAALDFVHSVGYFNFANRIMLALGEPVLA